jgi:hypothetical protein
LVAVLRGGSDAAGFFGVLALGCLATFGLTRRPSYTGHDRPGVGSFLGVARWIRNQPWAITLYCWLRTWILPGAFLFASIILILGGVNKAAFEVADSMGAFCAEPTRPETMAPLPAQKAGEQPAAAVSGFDIATMCADTGIKLKEGVTYRIELSVTKRWTDGDYPADPYGFSAGAHGIRAALLFTPATLIKRWWAEPWMRPIARIGRFGNDEYALAPVQPDDKGLGNNVQLTAEFTARTTGRLYLYVNDAVLAVPGLSGFFYHTENGFFEPGNNVGTASVTVTAFEK